MATPLDYALPDTPELIDLLTSMGAVSAVKESATDTPDVEQEVARSKQEVEGSTETEMLADNEMSVASVEVVAEAETSPVPSVSMESPSLRSLRPPTPTRPPSEAGPTFETPAPLAPPPKAHLLQRALSALGRKGQTSNGSILNSCVGVYAAHATLLTAAVLGRRHTYTHAHTRTHATIHTDTALGDKTIDVAHHVAMERTADIMTTSDTALPGQYSWTKATLTMRAK